MRFRLRHHGIMRQQSFALHANRMSYCTLVTQRADPAHETSDRRERSAQPRERSRIVASQSDTICANHARCTICQEHKDASPPSFSPFSPADTLPLADRPRRPAHGPHRAARRPAAAASGRRPDRSRRHRGSDQADSWRRPRGTQADAEAMAQRRPRRGGALLRHRQRAAVAHDAAAGAAVAGRVRRDPPVCHGSSRSSIGSRCRRPSISRRSARCCIPT